MEGNNNFANFEFLAIDIILLSIPILNMGEIPTVAQHLSYQHSLSTSAAPMSTHLPMRPQLRNNLT